MSETKVLTYNSLQVWAKIENSNPQNLISIILITNALYFRTTFDNWYYEKMLYRRLKNDISPRYLDYKSLLDGLSRLQPINSATK